MDRALSSCDFGRPGYLRYLAQADPWLLKGGISLYKSALITPDILTCDFCMLTIAVAFLVKDGGQADFCLVSARQSSSAGSVSSC
jgi:hypothetical protein